MADPTIAKRLREQLLQRWTNFPEDQLITLNELINTALDAATTATPELITVMNPVSRPQRLQLTALVDDKGLDTMYQQEWAELAVSSDGLCYLVYRRRSGSEYAIVWSPATTLPATMAGQLPECLVLALLGDDNNDLD